MTGKRRSSTCDPFFTKIWENNCNLEKIMFKEGWRGHSTIAFFSYSEGLGAGRGSTESLKFANPSGLPLQGVVTIEVHVRFGCLCPVFQLFPFYLGVSADTLDMIDSVQGWLIITWYNITTTVFALVMIFLPTITFALVFVHRLFLSFVFAF